MWVLWQLAQEFVLFWKLPCVLCVATLPLLSIVPTLMPGAGLFGVGTNGSSAEARAANMLNMISANKAEKPILILLIFKNLPNFSLSL
ncbi:hypothetical protein [Neobacillus drentensis]|uniref:hypothetical protein n=1 Tax=Neobacillus drentensis TaxID=220684 RepID=UPI001F337EF8|nr:hypothetical protein [Neobacillus drentensis]